MAAQRAPGQARLAATAAPFVGSIDGHLADHDL
jgi:hypothetical protein